MKKKSDLGIRYALYKIQRQSPFCHMVGFRSNGEDVTKPEWSPAEAGLAWAIYERSVLDANGFLCYDGTAASRGQECIQTAKALADTGMIDTPHGRRNILELLGIDPEWAAQIISKVSTKFNMAVADGWSP